MRLCDLTFHLQYVGELFSDLELIFEVAGRAGTYRRLSSFRPCLGFCETCSRPRMNPSGSAGVDVNASGLPGVTNGLANWL